MTSKQHNYILDLIIFDSEIKFDLNTLDNETASKLIDLLKFAKKFRRGNFNPETQDYSEAIKAEARYEERVRDCYKIEDLELFTHYYQKIYFPVLSVLVHNKAKNPVELINNSYVELLYLNNRF